MFQSILEVKNFHCLIFRCRDQNIVPELNHRTDKVLMLRLHREEIISRRGQVGHGTLQVLLAALAARVSSTTLTFLVIVAVGATRAYILIQLSILDL